MNNYLGLIEEISEYVTDLFHQYPMNDLVYHNLNHTKTVVKRALEIAADYPFGETELFTLTASAWFHDTGHLVGGAKLHEDRSVAIMQKFLESKGVTKEIIDEIESCICATKLPQQPKSLIEKIVCDADTYNLGTKEFIQTDKLLKKECKLRNMPVDNWEEKTLNLLESHKYFTSHCQSLLNKGRETNIDLVQSHLKKGGNK